MGRPAWLFVRAPHPGRNSVFGRESRGHGPRAKFVDTSGAPFHRGAKSDRIGRRIVDAVARPHREPPDGGTDRSPRFIALGKSNPRTYSAPERVHEQSNLWSVARKFAAVITILFTCFTPIGSRCHAGTTNLSDMADLALPDSVSWWPLAPGWWVLGLFVVILLCWAWILHRRAWLERVYRREALALLDELDGKADAQAVCREVNEVLKRAAITAYGRERVASLYGAEWVLFLNEMMPEAVFGADMESLLGAGLYTGKGVDTGTVNTLLEAARTWIRLHPDAEEDEV